MLYASDMAGIHDYHRIVDVEHALSCLNGGFASIRRNKIGDIPSSLMSEVCHAIGRVMPSTSQWGTVHP